LATIVILPPFFSLLLRPPPPSTLFPYTTLFRSLHRQGFSPGAEQEETQHGITNDVTGLAQNVMPGFEMGLVYAEEEMKNRVQDVAGVLAGEVGRGFNTNNDQPENGGDPRFNEVLLGGAQDRRESY